MTRLLPGAVIFAKQPERLAEFYQAVASMNRIWQQADKIVLATEQFSLVIHALPEAIASSIVLSQPPVWREQVAIKPYLPVSSLHQARAVATQHGGGLDPVSHEWRGPGWLACDGWDPEGNRVQWRQPLPETDA